MRRAIATRSQLVCLISVASILAVAAGPVATAGQTANKAKLSANKAAARIDQLLEAELAERGVEPAPLVNDEDFLRRVTFDLAGTVPSSVDLTLFMLDPDPQKRSKLIDRLLESAEFAENWAAYWREVIYSRATDQRARLARGAFEEWLAEQLKVNKGWDQITTELLTATGVVAENGATGFIFAHGGDARELAGETSRIFLGIQIQCANCHDHPTDQWKREQFHQLAAFFPRIRVRRSADSQRSFEVVSFDVGGRRRNFLQPEALLRRFDRNNDRKLTKEEGSDTPLARFFQQLLQRGDADKDGALSLAELKKVPRPAGRGRQSVEYFMPDLSDPSSRGTRVDPVFFVNHYEPQQGLPDVERRAALAEAITSPQNPWFARAFVNRIWAEMLGEGFYMPIDDMGPERSASFPKVLDLLASSFTANGYDIKWLFRTIANTEAYQRQLHDGSTSQGTPPFAAASPTRLRADQLYNAPTKVLGTERLAAGPPRRRGGFRGPRSERAQFGQLFGFDPSTPQEEITGDVPQALFLMNSPAINNLIRADRDTRLARILQKFDDDKEAVSELYLLVLAREPSRKETAVALKYVADVGNRKEAFEDLMWALLNSSEFLTKR